MLLSTSTFRSSSSRSATICWTATICSSADSSSVPTSCVMLASEDFTSELFCAEWIHTITARSPPQQTMTHAHWPTDLYTLWLVTHNWNCSINFTVVEKKYRLYTSCNNNNNNIITIIPRQYLWCCHHGRAIARVYPVHLMNVERRQAAADPRPSQTT